MKILMVCLGNICRSPLAEGILRGKAEQKGLNIVVDSCGTAGYHIGSPPDSRSVSKAKEYGIDITMLRGRKFSVRDFDKFDLIIPMDKYNCKDLLDLAENEDHKKKIKMMMDFLYPGKNKDVPDPYYGEDDGFETVYQMLDKAIDKMLDEF
jgi:protein-tyrosine phosphatase